MVVFTSSRGRDALTLFGWLMPVYGGIWIEFLRHHNLNSVVNLHRGVPHWKFSFRTSGPGVYGFQVRYVVLVGIRKHFSVFFLLPISNKSESIGGFWDGLSNPEQWALCGTARRHGALSLARYLHYLLNHCSLDCWCKITLALKRFRVLIYLCQWEITSALHQQWSYKMSHEVESMAWAHRFRSMASATELREMLPAMRCSSQQVSVGSVRPIPCFNESVDGRCLSNARHLFVPRDGRVLTVVSNNWRPFQNKDAMNFFRGWKAAVRSYTLGIMVSLHGGKVVWALARVSAGFTISGGDSVKAYVLLVSPHEVGKASTARGTGIRVVCANTLAM